MIGGKKMHFEGPDHFSRALLTHGKSDNDLMHTIDLLLSQKIRDHTSIHIVFRKYTLMLWVVVYNYNDILKL